MKVSDFGLIVLNTHQGNANSLAYFIDQKYVSYSNHDKKNYCILETIAGDDTVVTIVQNKEALKETVALFKSLFPYL